MDLELAGKVVVITGGAKGIGAAVAVAFAAEGALVAILDNDVPSARDLEARIRSTGNRALAIEVDLRDADRVQQAFALVRQEFGPVGVLVNNAGGNDAIGLRHPPHEFADSLARNLNHYFTCVHFALDDLCKGQGTIVNISSKIALTGQGGTSGYAAAKGAICALTREWAAELARCGVRVNAVMPAEVITPMYQAWLDASPDPAAALAQLNQTIPLGHRTTRADEVAAAVVFLASGRSSHTTGEILCVDGGYVHLDRALTSKTSHLKTSA